jgi:deazaflavin-dependent oxidoreductase (nitroreductase family)
MKERQDMTDRFIELNETGWIAKHREQYMEDGEAGQLWDSSIAGGPGPLPTLLLFTVGRKSGKESVMPLLYHEVAGGYAIIASRGGDSRHPGWYHNLVARNEVGVRIANDSFRATAYTTAGDERAAIWDRMVAMYPPFADYGVTAAPREIPVVVLRRHD